MKMTNKDDGAFACASNYAHQAGLTKREYISAKVLAGFVSDKQFMAMVADSAKKDDVDFSQYIAELSVEVADELIKALNKSRNESQI